MILCVRECENELVIRRSRFIALSRHIESREQAEELVSSLKAAHPEARHVCYAFIADEKGDVFGYSDDGEPSGTAGKPIYSALAASEARMSAVAVVRYFGGIKLGAGGLTRAYRESAAAVIEKAGLARAERMAVYKIDCDGESYKKAAAVLRSSGCEIGKIMYGKNVEAEVTADASFDIVSALSFTGVIPVKTGESYVYTDK